MPDIQLAILTAEQAAKLKSLLVMAARKAHRVKKHVEVFSVYEGKNFRIAWDEDVQLKATDAVLALDDLLAQFLMIEDEFKKKWATRKAKKPGRRRPAENYWLAGEIAEVVQSVPGVRIKYSKGDQTVFMSVLEVCFRAIGHHTSLERVAREVAREHQPAVVDDETFAEYKRAISKRKPDPT